MAGAQQDQRRRSRAAQRGISQPRSYVEVDSIDETLAKVEASGGTVVMPKSPTSETSWWAFFNDPDGNTIGVYEGITEVDRSDSPDGE